MLDYARHRARELLQAAHSAVLATSGSAGVQAGEFPCETAGLIVYMLLPGTSDHLFNLESNPAAALLTAGWEMKGTARVIPVDELPFGLSLAGGPGAAWCVILEVMPLQLQVRGNAGWGFIETIEFDPPPAPEK
jgi:hypothetical protein